VNREDFEKALTSYTTPDGMTLAEVAQVLYEHYEARGGVPPELSEEWQGVRDAIDKLWDAEEAHGWHHRG